MISSAPMDVKSPSPVDVLGVPVAPFMSYEEALGSITRAVEARRPSFWVAINPQKIHRAWNEPDLMTLLRAADVGICDGIGVAIASRLLNGQGMPRCTGCDLFFRLLALAAEKGWGVFLLGASPESNEKACQNIVAKYPALQIVGRQHGFFEDSDAVVRAINDSGADLLFVAMGTPKQEYWIWRHRAQLRPVFCMGVGGSLDVAGGAVRRAPALFRKTGTEFLYRLITEPSKRWRSQMAYYFPYTFRVLRERVLRGRSASASR